MDLGRALARLLRPERSLVLRVLHEQRLTVPDVLRAAPAEQTQTPGSRRSQVSPPKS